MAQEEDAIVSADGKVRWALRRQDKLFWFDRATRASRAVREADTLSDRCQVFASGVSCRRSCIARSRFVKGPERLNSFRIQEIGCRVLLCLPRDRRLRDQGSSLVPSGNSRCGDGWP